MADTHLMTCSRSYLEREVRTFLGDLNGGARRSGGFTTGWRSNGPSTRLGPDGSLQRVKWFLHLLIFHLLAKREVTKAMRSAATRREVSVGSPL